MPRVTIEITEGAWARITALTRPGDEVADVVRRGLRMQEYIEAKASRGESVSADEARIAASLE